MELESSLSLGRRILNIENSAQFEELAAQVRDWEPRLDVYIPPADALLYEPDGTLYAVCLCDEMKAITGHRERLIRKGDLIVVPQAVAVDARPEVDVLGIRYDGPPPDHFRERFVQVWGLEHLASPIGTRFASEVTHELIRDGDCRHRVPYAIVEVGRNDAAVEMRSTEMRLCVGLIGDLNVVLQSNGRLESTLVKPRQLLAVAPGATMKISGSGRLGVLTLMNELLHMTRRLDFIRSGGRISQEYEPPACSAE